MTAPELLRAMAEQFQGIRDYEVMLHCESPGRRRKHRDYKLEFLRRGPRQQSHMFRLNIHSGPDKGADIIVRGDGAVRMRNRGPWEFPFSLRRDSSRLRIAEGMRLWEADFGSVIGRLTTVCEEATTCSVEEIDAAGLKQLARTQRRKVDWVDPAGAYRLRIEHQDAMDQPALVEMLVSRTTLMPLQCAHYRSGRLVDRLTFTRFRPNAGKKARRFEF